MPRLGEDQDCSLADGEPGPMEGFPTEPLNNAMPPGVYLGMDERDVMERLGPPDEIVGREDRMRSRGWICSTCREMTVTTEPQPLPAPCVRCGGIAFETVHVEPH
jgi:hypothetical protein